MLPTHGGYGGSYGGYGKRSRGGQLPISTIASGCLAVLVLWLGWSNMRSSRLNNVLTQELHDKRASASTLEDTLSYERSKYQHLEHQFNAQQRRYSETSREVQDLKITVGQKSNEYEACQKREGQLTEELRETREKLAYEHAVVEAHKHKMTQLEKAHEQREADWHALSKKWAQFEEDAVKENLRLLGELNKLTAAAAPAGTPSPSPAAATPTERMPDQEPQTRPETQFDVKVALPKEEEYVHHYATRAAAAQQAAQATQTTQQAHEQQGTQNTQPAGTSPGSLPSPPGSEPSPNTPAGSPEHAAPQPPEHHEHDHVYDQNWGEHLDPLDHYWMDDKLEDMDWHHRHNGWRDNHGRHNEHPNEPEHWAGNTHHQQQAGPGGTVQVPTHGGPRVAAVAGHTGQAAQHNPNLLPRHDNAQHQR